MLLQRIHADPDVLQLRAVHLAGVHGDLEAQHALAAALARYPRRHVRRLIRERPRVGNVPEVLSGMARDEIGFDPDTEFMKVLDLRPHERIAPRLPGSAVIRPIESLSCLEEEGRSMRHCIGDAPHAWRFAAREFDAYHVATDPPATLALRYASGAPSPRLELRGPSNSVPAKVSVEAVRTWLLELPRCRSRRALLRQLARAGRASAGRGN